MLDSIPMIGGARLTPLPKDVLPSTMEVREPVVDDEHGGGYSAPRTIANVRLIRQTELTAATSGGAQGGYLIEDDASGTVIIDAASSSGAYEVPERSLVSIDGGAEMEVVRVRRFDHFDGSCHHWEVSVR